MEIQQSIRQFDNIYSIIEIAKKAGQEIFKIFLQFGASKEEGFIKYKTDNSPVTAADILANEIICSELKKITPDIPILSEEESNIPFAIRKKWHRYWLIDPLDGTGEFIHHSPEFTINIALIENHHSVLGVSYIPAEKTCYFARRGEGAFKEDAAQIVSRIYTHKINKDKIRVGISKYLGIQGLERFLFALGSYELVYLGSSLKLCRLAEGLIDVYPRLNANFEWDTAAGQCILEEAGGSMVDINFNFLKYNTKESLSIFPFLAFGDQSFLWKKYLQFLV